MKHTYCPVMRMLKIFFAAALELSLKWLLELGRLGLKLLDLASKNFIISELENDVSNESLDVIRSNRINGKVFLTLTDNDLKEIISLLGERKAIKSIINYYKAKDKAVSYYRFTKVSCLNNFTGNPRN